MNSLSICTSGNSMSSCVLNNGYKTQLFSSWCEMLLLHALAQQQHAAAFPANLGDLA